MIIAGIRQFGLASDGSDLRDLEAAIERLKASPAMAIGDEMAERAARAAYEVWNDKDDKWAISWSVVKEAWIKQQRAALAVVFASCHLAEGWKAVPIDPTEEMRRAGVDAAMTVGDVYTRSDGTVVIETAIARDIYRAILAAAPAGGME
jgi:hypothetical protein